MFCLYKLIIVYLALDDTLRVVNSEELKVKWIDTTGLIDEMTAVSR